MDAETFALHYKNWGPQLLRKTYYLLQDEQAAADIVQESFMAMWKKPPLSVEKNSQLAWLYNTCHNRAIDLLRRRVSQQRHLSDLQLRQERQNHNENLKTPEDRQVWRHYFLQIISRLNKSEQRLFAYRFIDGLELGEISQLSGISLRTLQRRLKSLQDRLAVELPR